MAEWFRRKTEKINTTQKKDIKEGVWIKCSNCGNVLSKKILKDKFNCCTSCNFHFKMNPEDYLALLLDDFTELWSEIQSQDPLNFIASKSYKDQLMKYNEESHLTDAVRVFSGKINSKKVVLCIMDFSFINCAVTVFRSLSPSDICLDKDSR